jgi:hypothetical protein
VLSNTRNVDACFHIHIEYLEKEIVKKDFFLPALKESFGANMIAEFVAAFAF